jgi:hypothetical protein
MPDSDNFDGTFGSGMTMTFTNPTTSVVINIWGIETATPPIRNFKVDKYTPISGTRARKEQAVICSRSEERRVGKEC